MFPGSVGLPRCDVLSLAPTGHHFLIVLSLTQLLRATSRYCAGTGSLRSQQIGQAPQVAAKVFTSPKDGLIVTAGYVKTEKTSNSITLTDRRKNRECGYGIGVMARALSSERPFRREVKNPLMNEFAAAQWLEHPVASGGRAIFSPQPLYGGHTLVRIHRSSLSISHSPS